MLLAAAMAAACEAESPTAPSPRFTLTGNVSDGSQGLPSTNVEVISGPNQGQRATTDSDGRYAFPLLFAGTFSIRASATGYEPQMAVVNLNSNVTADFQLLRQLGSGDDDLVSVSGVVSDADGGAPLSGVGLQVIVGPDTGRTTTTDGDGRFLLTNLRPGAIEIEVAAPGYETIVLELVAGSVDVLTVALERAPVGDPDRVSLSGTVSGIPSPGTDPAPIEGALVTLLNGPNAGRTAHTDGDGQYHLDDLIPGRTRLEVAAPEFVTSTTRVTIATDSTSVDVELRRIEPHVTTRGRVVDVLSGAARTNVTFTGIGLTAAPSDSTGAFEVGAVSGSTEPRRVTLASPEVVTRQTHIRVPDIDIELSLIPATFNLAAFDEMLRNPRLRRWRTAPPLIIERQAIQVSGVDASHGTALDDPMSDEELESLQTDLQWALSLLTSNTFTAFASITERLTDPGSESTLMTTGVITIVRVQGLEATTGTSGWARWLFERDGTVIGGVIMLDLDFDRGDSRNRRSLRAHELGHALGYAHVSTVASVMNPSATLEPTEFDRAATLIAFARQPGNVAPDTEPEPGVQPSSLGPATWSPPIP